MQRMPHLGGLLGELIIMLVVVIKLVLDSVISITAAASKGGWPALAELMRPRFGKLTFHSMLDSAGANLLSVDDLTNSIEQLALFMGQCLIKLGAILDGRPGSRFVRNVVFGTAKVVQYSDGLIPATDPISRQILAVHMIPSATIVSAIGTMGVSMGRGGVLLPLGQMSISMSRVTTLNFRLLRRILIRLLCASSVVDAIQGILLATVFESKQDFDSFFATMRMQCQGLSETIGSGNPFGKMIRHLCYLSPTSMEFVLTVIRVIFVEYVVMSCACGLSVKDQIDPTASVFVSTCLQRFSPAIHQAWMLQLLCTPDNMVRRNMCFANMDGANQRLLTALDGFLQRVYKLSQSIPEALEFLISFISKDKSGCDAYLLSPYAVSMIPEPVDYFMACIHVPDCRIRCLSEYQAFDQLLNIAKTGQRVPKYHMEAVFAVESPIFDAYKFHDGAEKPPFELFVHLELL
jgi:hypothetical protein